MGSQRKPQQATTFDLADTGVQDAELEAVREVIFVAHDEAKPEFWELPGLEMIREPDHVPQILGPELRERLPHRRPPLRCRASLRIDDRDFQLG